jgi:hypothetical protein
VDGSNLTEPPQIGVALSSLRAAIDVVADGGATRVTVHLPGARQLFPAATQLARRASVRVELVETTEPEPELTVIPIAASGR